MDVEFAMRRAADTPATYANAASDVALDTVHSAPAPRGNRCLTLGSGDASEAVHWSRPKSKLTQDEYCPMDCRGAGGYINLANSHLDTFLGYVCTYENISDIALLALLVLPTLVYLRWGGFWGALFISTAPLALLQIWHLVDSAEILISATSDRGFYCYLSSMLEGLVTDERSRSPYLFLSLILFILSGFVVLTQCVRLCRWEAALSGGAKVVTWLDRLHRFCAVLLFLWFFWIAFEMDFQKYGNTSSQKCLQGPRYGQTSGQVGARSSHRVDHHNPRLNIWTASTRLRGSVI